MANTSALCILGCTDFTIAEQGNLEIANVTTSSFSLIGSLFIIIIYLRVRELRSFAFRLVFLTAIADFFFSLGGLLGDAGGNPETFVGANTELCLFQSFIISYFQLASLIWSVSIAFTLHMGFLKRRVDFNPKEVYKHEKKYHLVAWTYPLVMAILPFTTNSYGDEGGYCWIQSHSEHVSWRFIQFYVPLLIAIIYNAYVFFNVWIKIREYTQFDDDKAKAKMVARLKFYPLVLVVCHLFGFFVSIQEVVTGGRDFYDLSMMYLIFSSLQGFANAFVYGLTPDVQSKVFPCLGQKEEAETQLKDTTEENMVNP